MRILTFCNCSRKVTFSIFFLFNQLNAEIFIETNTQYPNVPLQRLGYRRYRKANGENLGQKIFLEYLIFFRSSPNLDEIRVFEVRGNLIKIE